MGLGFRSFIKALFVAINLRGLTSRRFGFYFVFFPIFSFLFFLVFSGQVIDNLFFQGYRCQEVHSPIFIISTPRSGTTLLHRALSLDEHQFTYFQTYQTLLPSVFLYKAVGLITSLNRHLGKQISRLENSLNSWLFTRWSGIHPTGLSEAEEDEGLFIYTFHTPAVYLLFPVVNQIPSFRFSDDLPARLRQRLMAYYKGCLQRFLYTFGQGRTLLSKNVLSVGRLQSLMEAFPDARVIYIVRHPYQAIPSLLSLFYAVWRGHSPEIPKCSPETKALAQMGMDYYRYLMQVVCNFPDSQCLYVRYEDLVADLPQVVERIYSHFGLKLDREFQSCLQELYAQQKNYESSHQYSLEEYGLRREVIFSKLADVFEKFGFTR